jgi:hypothetical protein
VLERRVDAMEILGMLILQRHGERRPIGRDAELLAKRAFARFGLEHVQGLPEGAISAAARSAGPAT